MDNRDDAPGDMIIENNNAFLMAMGEGSRIEIHAADASKQSWTQINQTAAVGATQITLADNTGWRIGDKIAIASSGFDMDEAEERVIVAVSVDGKTITLDSPLQHKHFGEIETYDNGLQGQNYQSWELDMRAEVALLSRNVTIQGDADSATDGYGGHSMVMNGAEMHIDGAEFTQMGQKGLVGKYALHWHMLGDAAGQYITNTSIHDTYNKGMTIHGTQNTWVESNAIYDTIGHSYYFEDGSEFGNVLMDNLGMNTNRSESVEAGPIGSDHTAVSTYWVTNPNNHLIDNHAAGSERAGFWILSQDHTEGASAESGLYDDYVPRAQAPGQWVGNTSHSNGRDGIFIGRQFDEETGQASSGDRKLEEQYQITDFTTYKNEDFGLWVRNGTGSWDDIKIADSAKGVRFWGLNDLEDSLIVGRSGNYEQHGSDVYHGWELYDQASHFDDVHFEGFSGELDAAIANHSGFGRSSNNSISGLTFGDGVPEKNFFRGKVFSSSQDGLRDNGGSLAGALYDLDGSLTGQAGAVITPGIMELNVGEDADVVNYAFEGIAASGFNAAEGAVWQADSHYWLNPAGSIIGKMNFLDSGDEAQRNDFTIARADNGAKIFYGSDTQGANGRSQLNVDGRGDVEYVVEYPNGLPETISLQIQELPQGASAYYRFKDLPEDVVLQGATEVGGRGALDNATETAWFRDGNGDFVVKVYADRFQTNRGANDETLPIVSDLVFSDEFKIIIANRTTANPSGNSRPIDAPDDYRPDPNPTPLPERAESTSNTTDITDGMSRWSDGSSWDGAVPGANDIVVIGPGKTVVLDESATVKGMIINGGELIIADGANLTIDLVSDYVLVINGGLFQAGTEDDPLDTNFTLTLEGDDPDFDLEVTSILRGEAPNTVNAIGDTPTDGQVYVATDVELSEDQVVAPVTDTAATGSFDAVFDPETRQLEIAGDFSNLASDVTMMHLHSGAAGQTGGVLYALTVTSADGRNGAFEGAFTLSEEEAAQYLAGETYVNLHTVDTPGGVLRGQALPGELQEPETGPQPTLGSLSGQIVDGAAAGVAAALIVLVDANGDTVASVMTQPDGSYDFELLLPGQYRVRAVDTGEETPLIDVVAGQEAMAGALEIDTTIDPIAELSLGDGDNQFDGTAGADSVNGEGGDDVLWGRGEDDTLFGGDGGDTLRGGQDADTLSGDAGDDIVTGDRGVDYVDGGDGADIVRGGADDDQVFGRAGDDYVVSGDAGNDQVYGGGGDDVVRGGAGDDMVSGGFGDDRIVGDRGDDRLLGGEGDDVLLGFFGDDYLLGGAGADILSGGGGNDVYAFEAGGGQDVLIGFEVGADKIDISAYDGLTAEDVLAQAKDAPAGGVKLDFGDGDSAVIRDIELTDLSAGDFIVS
ncbi:MAG: CHRD domain-containing protein [Rhodobacteraceae bacterium]|nr:CHRD domain-containing protein [Paracoccaceae bacterium]